MKAKIFAAALLVTVFCVGFSSRVSAHPWHRGYGYFRPHVAVRVGIPAPVVVTDGYYAPGYCAPAPAPVYYGGDCYRRPVYREYYGRGYYGGRAYYGGRGYGRGFYRRGRW